MMRVDVEPLLQDVMRRQLWELLDDCGVMRTFRADQDTVPLPAAGLGWFDQQDHLATEQVGGQSTEHSLGEEAGMILEGLKDPFVVEGSHRSHDRAGGTYQPDFMP
jgi:hypothetical protein